MNYTAIAAQAAQAISIAGQSVTIRKFTAGAYDPATGTASSTFTDTVTSGCLLPFGSGQTFFNGGQIITNDARLLLDPAADFAITDSVFVGGVEFNIVSNLYLNPAGVNCLHDLHLRRS
jgi:hypothetical protein